HFVHPVSPFVCLAAHDCEFLRWTSLPTYKSNSCCHPGKAGGLPVLITGVVAGGQRDVLGWGYGGKGGDCNFEDGCCLDQYQEES
ncbi:MAG: hypothetical protein Q7T21_03875, partial [Gallionella sp.]|nr:hypothetical protein [Gallionella sp.]